MGNLVGVLLLIGLVVVLGKVVVGWLLTGIVIAILLGALFLKGAVGTRTKAADRLVFGSCGALWLLFAGLSQFALRPWHAFLLFVIAALATAAFGVALWYPGNRWANRVSITCAILAWIPVPLLCWRDCRSIPELLAFRDWTTYTENEQLKVTAPVLAIRTDLSREAWLERVVRVGRLPRVSDALPVPEPGEAKSVVLLVYGDDEVGSYIRTGSGSSGSAYQNRCTLMLLDRASRQRRALGTVLGPAPPSTSSGGSEYGAQPDDSEVRSHLLRSIAAP